MEIIPLGDRVIIKPGIPEEMVGLIVVPATATKKIDRGKIIAIGPDCKYNIHIDDLVVFKDGAGIEITLERVNYISISEKDIVGTIKKEETNAGILENDEKQPTE
jgi:chaperonin GroES